MRWTKRLAVLALAACVPTVGAAAPGPGAGAPAPSLGYRGVNSSGHYPAEGLLGSWPEGEKDRKVHWSEVWAVHLAGEHLFCAVFDHDATRETRARYRCVLLSCSTRPGEGARTCFEYPSAAKRLLNLH